ncbi:MAG: NAD-dependent epimerase/dehydratase family protein [Candidatus Eisenbacteria bacterium]|uniref:UDP-glucuronate decarboxylase n=1 Tax=Eiseniibacteriota bacterium TaxID=2212470 RepID=A0A538SM85_UNCEI|nr:MAG: NAD-dependent epimerase/dehydratase family protein [Candidatus Eisenbacteria bacterium]
MRVLVTGGAGFIGSHLSEKLIQQGSEVWALDDLSTGRLENLRSFERHPHFRFLEGSVTDSALVNGLVAQCDRVYHLAAAVGVKYVLENPLRSLITNIRGTEVILEAWAEHGRKAMVFSSSEVYGKGVSVPFSEDDDRVMGPTHKLRWSYACGKAVDESLAQAYWQQRQLPVVIVRCFNTCGPRQTGSYGMVIPNMIVRALRDEPILVFGDGKQSRCFSAVSDVVRGVLMLADCKAAEGEVFNVGSDEEVTVLELAERIRRMCDSRSPIEFVAYEKVYGSSFEDMRRRVPDLTKIGRFVGFRPQSSLQQLLEITIRDTCERMGLAYPVGLAAA